MKKLLLLVGAGVLIALATLIIYGWMFYRSFNPLTVFDPGFYFTPKLEMILKAKGFQASVLETLSLAPVWPPITGSSVFNFSLPSEVTATIQSSGQPANYSIGLSFSLVSSEGISSVEPLNVGEFSFAPIIPPVPAGESFELVLPITADQQEVSVVLPPSLIAAYNNFANGIIAASEADLPAPVAGSETPSAPAAGLPAGSSASGVGVDSSVSGGGGSPTSNSGSPTGTGSSGGGSSSASSPSGLPTSAGLPAPVAGSAPSGDGSPAAPSSPAPVAGGSAPLSPAETTSEPGLIESVINAINDAVVAVNNLFTDPIAEVATDVSDAISSITTTDEPSVADITPTTVPPSSSGLPAGAGTTVTAPAAGGVTSPTATSPSGSSPASSPVAADGSSSLSPSSVSPTDSATGFFDALTNTISDVVDVIVGFFFDPIVEVATSISDSINLIATNQQSSVYRDYGDAPAPGNGGNFPSRIFDNGSRHKTTYPFFLGDWVDVEPDSLQVNDDAFDDGLEPSTWLIKISNNSWTEGPIYLNMLIDLNHDGDWDESDSEWVVQNQAVVVPVGTSKTVLPLISNLLVGLAFPVADSWVRITVTAAPVDVPYIGAGSFAYGESEDHYIPLKNPPPPAKASVYNSGVPAVKLPGKLVDNIISDVVVVPTPKPTVSQPPRPPYTEKIHEQYGSFLHSIRQTKFDYDRGLTDNPALEEGVVISGGKQAPISAPVPTPEPVEAQPEKPVYLSDTDEPVYIHEKYGSFWHSYSSSYYEWKRSVAVTVSSGKQPTVSAPPVSVPAPTPTPAPVPTVPVHIRPAGFKYAYHVFNSSNYVPGVYHIGDTTEIKYTDPSIETEGYKPAPLCTGSADDSDSCVAPISKPAVSQPTPPRSKVDIMGGAPPESVIPTDSCTGSDTDPDSCTGGEGSDVLTAPAPSEAVSEQNLFESIVDGITKTFDSIFGFGTEPSIEIPPLPKTEDRYEPRKPILYKPTSVTPPSIVEQDKISGGADFPIHDVVPSTIQSIQESAIQGVRNVRDTIYESVIIPFIEPALVTPEDIERQLKASESSYGTPGVPSDTTIFNVAYPISRQAPEVQVNIVEAVPPAIRQIAVEQAIRRQIIAQQQEMAPITAKPLDQILQQALRDLTAAADALVKSAENRGLIIQPTAIPIVVTDPQIQQEIAAAEEQAKAIELPPGVTGIPLPRALPIGTTLQDFINVSDATRADIPLTSSQAAKLPNSCSVRIDNLGPVYLVKTRNTGLYPADLVIRFHKANGDIIQQQNLISKFFGARSYEVINNYFGQPSEYALRTGQWILVLRSDVHVPFLSYIAPSFFSYYTIVPVGESCTASDAELSAKVQGGVISNPATQAGSVGGGPVVAACAAGPTITTTTLANGLQDTPYSRSVLASGGEGSVTFSIVSGSLPTGLTLSAAGLISGTPTVIQLASFTVRATDSCSSAQTDDQALTIDVQGGGA